MPIVGHKQDDLVDALSRALVLDGFTRYSWGPEEFPTRVVSVYEWPHHVDVINVPREGPAVAARVAKPLKDPLYPPDAAVWAWGGPPESAIWALLNLRHPDDPQAPAQALSIPAELRIPPEARAAMNIQYPDRDKVGARGKRLSATGQTTGISEEFFRNLFQEVDTAGAIGAGESFTEAPTCTFQFADHPEVVGRSAIVKFVMDLYLVVSQVHHDLEHYWRVGEFESFTTGIVTFTKHDSTEVHANFATHSVHDNDGKLSRHQVFVNTAALIPASATTQN